VQQDEKCTSQHSRDIPASCSETPSFDIAENGRVIVFLPCRTASHHPLDIEHRYCVRCHRFVGNLADLNEADRLMSLKAREAHRLGLLNGHLDERFHVETLDGAGHNELAPDEDFGEPSIMLRLVLLIGLFAAIGAVAWLAYRGLSYVITVPVHLAAASLWG
jgi:hypothetical protein